jgi:hypothetical protein
MLEMSPPPGSRRSELSKRGNRRRTVSSPPSRGFVFISGETRSREGAFRTTNSRTSLEPPSSHGWIDIGPCASRGIWGTVVDAWRLEACGLCRNVRPLLPFSHLRYTEKHLW